MIKTSFFICTIIFTCHNVITISVVKNEIAGDVFADIIFHMPCYIYNTYIYVCVCVCVIISVIISYTVSFNNQC